ncbi:D-beta-hydroxybutyrate dehydrogenase, mitochondrial isoform X1 [Aethina tumida]|uniref:D-beta-hydroxybutyrate dehydrogenase, mitochondrial isoform X1 n=1 Tax=Aethina tumida TaxID=116153 RepID=UPI0021492C40|nr:D-beta-hydroxybutyrate dehydrogenase, mitochondrial isoform X1 [Aethina tumida]
MPHSKFLYAAFEILNETYVLIAGGPSACLLLLRNSPTFKSLLVASVTLSAGIYCLSTKRGSTPSSLPDRKNDESVVLVTGCDTGLGFSLAEHLVQEGFVVVAGFLKLDSLGSQLLPQTVIKTRLDITDCESVKSTVKIVEDLLDTHPNYKFHALVNNAATMVFGEFEWLTERLIDLQIQVNLTGTLKLTKAFCPILRMHKGRLITVTSHCSQATLPGLSVYGATKSALSAFSDGLRVEMAKYGVKVITFIPGSFPTESNIMSKQLNYVEEMHDGFTEEQHEFYGDYFKRYNVYLSFLTGPTVPKKINNNELYNKFDNCLLDECPSSVYKVEDWRYFMYHLLFRFSPVCFRDYFVKKFMQMPDYHNNK